MFIFISGYISSRSLSADDFGRLHYLTFLINVLWMFTNLGIPNIMSRYFPQAYQQHHKKAALRLLKISSVAFAITNVVIILLFYYFFKKANAGLPFIPLMLFAGTQFLLAYLNVFIQSVYQYATTFRMNLAACITGTLFLYFTISVLGPVAYIYAFILVNVMLCTGYIIVVVKEVSSLKDQPSSFVLPDTRSLFKTAAYFAVSAILAGIVWQRFELSMLKAYFKYDRLAVYSMAFTVIALFAEPLKLIPGVLLYYFANMGDKQEEASAKFEAFFKHFSWLVIFIGTFLWFDSEHIITLLYTDTYLESAYYVQLLLPGIIPGVCSYVLMSTHVGLGRARFLFIQDIITAALFLGLAITLIRLYGLEGAAWAKSIAIWCSVTMGLLYTHFRLKYKVPFQSLFLSVVISLLLAAPFREVFSDNWIFLIVKFVMMFMAYLLLSWMTRIIDHSLVKHFYHSVKAKLS